MIGGIFYSRLPQSGASDANQPPPTQNGASPTCTVSDATTRATVTGLGADGICLRMRDLYHLEVNSASAQPPNGPTQGLNPRCSYRNAAADLVTVEVSGSVPSDSTAASAICHDLAADASWQVVN